MCSHLYTSAWWLSIKDGACDEGRTGDAEHEWRGRIGREMGEVSACQSECSGRRSGEDSWSRFFVCDVRDRRGENGYSRIARCGGRYGDEGRINDREGDVRDGDQVECEGGRIRNE